MSRIFGFVGLLIAAAIGMYIYAQQMQSSSAAAGVSNPQAAISVTGVKNDLVNIAQAERRYYASEGKYATLDELIESSYISVARHRAPYTYAIETNGNGFRVVATRMGENVGGTPAEIAVDENMSLSQSN